MGVFIIKSKIRCQFKIFFVFSCDIVKNLIKGLRTSRIKGCLGGKHYDEVIHRDNLVLNDSCT
ncbi:MAG: hypothetical protein DRH26_06810 [Deltaproteobacteria bacterium]|nr:MAG: hypothetical protein DRH26_06810 [Deltaproteobacteria bacterium]